MQVAVVSGAEYYKKVIIPNLHDVIFSFKGEEIGMQNANISYEDTIDPQGCNCGPDRYQSKPRLGLE